jgi:hypothetical protein
LQVPLLCATHGAMKKLKPKQTRLHNPKGTYCFDAGCPLIRWIITSLTSLGRYALDFAALEPERLDQELLAAMSEQFPTRTRRLLQSHGYLSRA